MKLRAFTLIELLIAVVIIGLLVTAATVAIGTSLAKGRDSQRKADLSLMANALDKYNLDNRFYPLSGNPSGTGQEWMTSWTPTSAHSPWCTTSKCLEADPYIPDIENGYTSNLPTDPRYARADSKGYMYYSDGNDFRVVAANVVESVDQVPATDEYHEPTDVGHADRSVADKSYQISSPKTSSNLKPFTY